MYVATSLCRRNWEHVFIINITRTTSLKLLARKEVLKRPFPPQQNWDFLKFENVYTNQPVKSRAKGLYYAKTPPPSGYQAKKKSAPGPLRRRPGSDTKQKKNPPGSLRPGSDTKKKQKIALGPKRY